MLICALNTGYEGCVGNKISLQEKGSSLKRKDLVLNLDIHHLHEGVVLHLT